MGDWTRRAWLAAAGARVACGQRTEELELLEKTLVERHPGMKDAARRKAFTEGLAGVRGVEDEAHRAVALMKALARIGDSHTGLVLPQVLTRMVWPLGLYWFEEGIHVAAVAREGEAALGKKVVGIGRMSIEEACARMRGLMAYENEQVFQLRAVQWMSFGGLLQAAGIAVAGERIPVRVDGGGEVAVALTAKAENLVQVTAGKPVPLYRQNTAKRYWWTRLEPGMLYVQYNRCAEDPQYPMARMVEELRTEWSKGGVRRVIVDLRLNSGGDSRVFQPLLEALRKSELNAEGRLVGIIGRATFSSGMMNALQLRLTTKAKLVGGATGGKPNHFGELVELRLPQSGWTVRYSTKWFEMVKRDMAAVEPDVAVPVRFADYVAGRDAFLEAAQR